METLPYSKQTRSRFADVKAVPQSQLFLLLLRPLQASSIAMSPLEGRATEPRD